MHQPPFNALAQPQPTGWTAYAQYYPGTVVWYHGTYWRCEVAHTSGSEPGGAPNNNFHLWTPISSNGTPHPQSQGHQPMPSPSSPANPTNSYQQSRPSQNDLSSSYPLSQGLNASYYPPPAIPPNHPPNASPNSRSPYTSSNPPDNGTGSGSGSSSGDTVTGAEEESRGFPGGGKWDSEYLAGKANESVRYLTIKGEQHKAKQKDELKDELKGRRIWRVGGIGMWAYSLDTEVEWRKRELWADWGGRHGKDEWVKSAKNRTEFYNKESRGVKPLFMWKLVERGGPLPYDALPIGHEDNGQVLYAARAWWEHGLHLGKAGPHLVNGASISYGGAELTLDIYEVFCGPADPSLVKWMTFRHGERSVVDGWQPVEGGRESDGSAILLAKGEYEHGDHPGKCLINDDHACVGWGGGEVWVRPFQVLAYCSESRR